MNDSPDRVILRELATDLSGEILTEVGMKTEESPMTGATYLHSSRLFRSFFSRFCGIVHLKKTFMRELQF